MEQQGDTNYAEFWLERRNRNKPELDDEFLDMLAEMNPSREKALCKYQNSIFPAQLACELKSF